MTAQVEYIVVLVIAIGLTFLVGRLLVTAGEPFLQEVFGDRKVSRSVNLLLSVLFYLVTLGVLAIISTIDVNQEGQLQSVVVKLGVVLLVLGIAYGVSMLVLIRIRERRRAAQISEEVTQKLHQQGSAGTHTTGTQATESTDEPGGPTLGRPAPSSRQK